MNAHGVSDVACRHIGAIELSWHLYLLVKNAICMWFFSLEPSIGCGQAGKWVPFSPQLMRERGVIECGHACFVARMFLSLLICSLSRCLASSLHKGESVVSSSYPRRQVSSCFSVVPSGMPDLCHRGGGYFLRWGIVHYSSARSPCVPHTCLSSWAGSISTGLRIVIAYSSLLAQPLSSRRKYLRRKRSLRPTVPPTLDGYGDGKGLTCEWDTYQSIALHLYALFLPFCLLFPNYCSSLLSPRIIAFSQPGGGWVKVIILLLLLLEVRVAVPRRVAGHVIP